MIPGVVLILGGTEYTVPPLPLGAIEIFEKRINAYSGNAFDSDTRNLVADITACALRRNYPSITRKVLLGEYSVNADGEVIEVSPPLLDLSNFQDVMGAVMDVSGIKRKEQEAGKALAGPSTGAISTAT